MQHIAILRKANIKKGDNLLGDIVNGTKTIESRWYVNKVAPWGKIQKDDDIFFKESGGMVCAKAKVEKVIQIENLNQTKIRKIVNDYGNKIAPNTTYDEFLEWGQTQSNKNYCILVFLKNVQLIKPFEINKKGYGISSAWLVVENVNKLKTSLNPRK